MKSLLTLIALLLPFSLLAAPKPPKELYCLDRYHINLVDMPIFCGTKATYENPKQREETSIRQLRQQDWQLKEVLPYDAEFQLLIFSLKS